MEDFGTLGKQLNFKWDLMGHARRSMEDSGAESNLDYDAQLQRFQMGKRLFLVIFWPRM